MLYDVASQKRRSIPDAQVFYDVMWRLVMYRIAILVPATYIRFYMSLFCTTTARICPLLGRICRSPDTRLVFLRSMLYSVLTAFRIFHKYVDIESVKFVTADFGYETKTFCFGYGYTEE
jgi:hypothetical protein